MTLKVVEGCVGVASVPRRRCFILHNTLDIIKRSHSARLGGNSSLYRELRRTSVRALEADKCHKCAHSGCASGEATDETRDTGPEKQDQKQATAGDGTAGAGEGAFRYQAEAGGPRGDDEGSAGGRRGTGGGPGDDSLAGAAGPTGSHRATARGCMGEPGGRVGGTRPLRLCPLPQSGTVGDLVWLHHTGVMAEESL
nr:uncharacterized protein LOC111839813 isoform X2 [Paramormyrops kingsleyae]